MFLQTIKSILQFLCNKLVLMFIRHTLSEHLKLFAIVQVGTLLILCLPLGLVAHFEWITPSSEPWFMVGGFFDFLISFLDIHKLMYIGITYLVTLIVYFLHKEMVDFQTIRDQISKEKLTSELIGNTRAVLILMTNAISLILNLSIGISLVLFTYIYFGSIEMVNNLAIEKEEIFEFIKIAMTLEIAMYCILKFLIKDSELTIENYQNKSMSESDKDVSKSESDENVSKSESDENISKSESDAVVSKKIEQKNTVTIES